MQKNNISKTDVMGELSKEHSKALQGIAIFFMLILHIFCRYDNFPYSVSVYINGIPLLYYIGLWGDQCVAIYCFVAGYASYLQQEKFDEKKYIKFFGERIVKLLIRYWIIVLLFSGISILFGNANVMPGNLMTILGNVSLVNMTYNGAWWFLLTYLLLTILSTMLYRCVKFINPILIFLSSGSIYFISYLVRFNMIQVPSNNVIVVWIVEQAALLGTSLLGYIWGMMFYKYKLISFLRRKIRFKSRITKWICSIIGWIICIIVHGFVESLIVAPFFAMVTICIISLWSDEEIRFFKWLGKYSTNIWLIHMFFLIDDFISTLKYPVVIVGVILMICIFFSGIIDWIYATIICKYNKNLSIN